MKNMMKYTIIALSIAGMSGLAVAAPDMAKDESGGPINFEGNVINAPCVIQGTSKSQTVLLGDVTVKQLAANTKSEGKDFTISLEGCDLSSVDKTDPSVSANYTKAKIQFSGDKANTAGDILKLSAIEGAAQGVGVQIYEKGGTSPLTLGEGFTVEKDLEAGVSSYDFPFTAYYIKNGTPVSGKANATVNFTVFYE